MSFVFFELVTTGDNAAFDQIVDFAAIKTDADLNPIDQFEFRCRLLPHVVPSAQMLLETSFTVDDLTNPSFHSHYAMVCAIRSKLMACSPTIFIGYDSVGHNEHFLRQALYQTLHPPYLTNNDKNTRADILRMIQAVAVFMPDALKLPSNASGEPSLDLNGVARANGMTISINSAMRKVEAAVHMARILSDKAPMIWSAGLRFSKKASAADFLENEAVCAYAEMYYEKMFHWFVTRIGQHTKMNSDAYVFNLAVDPAALKSLNPTQLKQRLTRNPKPVRIVKVNGAPVLFSPSDISDFVSDNGKDADELEARAKAVRDDPAFCKRLCDSFEAAKSERSPAEHVEQQIYESFTEDGDVRLLDTFHASPWNNRPTILTRLKDKRLHELGERLIHIENPASLNSMARSRHGRHCAKRIAVHKVGLPWQTIPQVVAELNKAIPGLDLKSTGRLKRHVEHMQARLAECREHLTA